MVVSKKTDFRASAIGYSPLRNTTRNFKKTTTATASETKDLKNNTIAQHSRFRTLYTS